MGHKTPRFLGWKNVIMLPFDEKKKLSESVYASNFYSNFIALHKSYFHLSSTNLSKMSPDIEISSNYG